MQRVRSRTRDQCVIEHAIITQARSKCSTNSMSVGEVGPCANNSITTFYVRGKQTGIPITPIFGFLEIEKMQP